jgi:hypothetical protein
LDSQSKIYQQGAFSLLGVTASTDETSKAVFNFRQLIALHVKNHVTNIKLRQTLGQPVTSSQLLKSASTGGLPLLELPCEETHSAYASTGKMGLKEIVIPTYDYAAYMDGSSLLSRLSSLTRPITGLYQWTGSSTCIRPLPTALVDQRLPPPSLIFHCPSLDDVNVEELGASTAKIGFSSGKNGQLMVAHSDLVGLDLRYCQSTKVTSSFAEAQESLLAGSLDDLQSTNNLLDGGEMAKEDINLGKADCWVEVRANMKRPYGFWRRSIAPAKHRIAKAPDLPYE